MTGTEVRKLGDDQLKAEIKNLRERVFTLGVQATTEKVEDTSQFRKIRKDIARLLTEQAARRHAKSPKPVRAPKPPKAMPVKRVSKASKAASAKPATKVSARSKKSAAAKK